MDGRIKFLKAQFLENLKTQWTIEQMATAVELSSSHLRKIFKLETGIPPNTFLRELRLEKARELLETTFWRLQQIGIETGLIDASHFTHEFKKKYGLTPTAYRKQCWTNRDFESEPGNIDRIRQK